MELFDNGIIYLVKIFIAQHIYLKSYLSNYPLIGTSGTKKCLVYITKDNQVHFVVQFVDHGY